jgi:ketosteroid isomerase-like protein
LQKREIKITQLRSAIIWDIYYCGGLRLLSKENQICRKPMKHCPNCQTTYTDDTLRFCLQDGTPLAETADANTDMQTVSFDDTETLVSRKPPQQVVRINVPETERQDWEQTTSQSQNWERAEQPQIAAPPVAVKKSNTTSVVLATVLGMLVFFGIVGAGAWFLLQSRKNNHAAVNVSIATPTRAPVSNSANIQISNANLDANIEKPSPSPTATPLPKPTLKPQEAKAITNDVKEAVDEWKAAAENLDLDENLNQYADTVDYYNAGRVNQARVRDDKQRAFEQYDSINFKISNLKVTPDASGDKATVVFDKEWNFEGAEKYSAGKVQQQLTLGKIGGRWLITGEKDLKIYYVEK